jgi:hypothetical protein
LLARVGEGQYPERGIYDATEASLWGYSDCTPGEYGDAIQWDVRACYLSLLRALPTWRVSLGWDRLHWHRWRPGEEDRARQLLDQVAEEKALRNAMIGCMAGSKRGLEGWHRGEKCRLPGGLGRWRPAALVVARTAYELAWLESRACGSVYTATDAVTVVDGCCPEVWPSWGLEVREKAAGPAEICSHGVYRVGVHATEWYRRGSRYPIPESRLVDVGVRLSELWRPAA